MQEQYKTSNNQFIVYVYIYVQYVTLKRGEWGGGGVLPETALEFTAALESKNTKYTILPLF